MNIKELVKKQLQTMGAAGLYHSDLECGCQLDDLMPCGELNNLLDCEVAKVGEIVNGVEMMVPFNSNAPSHREPGDAAPDLVSGANKTAKPAAGYAEPASWVVELQDGCWLASWQGDPGRTLVFGSAKRFRNEHAARCALGAARRFTPFRGAKVYPFREAKVYQSILALLPNIEQKS